jgi:outer membrane protein assembly factor BamE (lipoprotein component of BamABCDE complex)
VQRRRVTTLLQEALCIALCVALCACIPVPVPGDPDPRRRENIDAHTGNAFQPGVSTREDVVMTLGEPYRIADDGSWFEYTDVRDAGHWVFIGGGPYQAGVLFETSNKIRYRTVTVFFDASGRVREVLNVGSQARLRPEVQLLEERVGKAVESGEIVRWSFTGAAWRRTERWVEGAVIVTDRAILFFETPAMGPLYQLALRLPLSAVTAAELGPDDQVAPSHRFAEIRRSVGTSEVFAFKSLEGEARRGDPAWDLSRAEQFIEIAGRARREANGQTAR